MSSLKEFYTNEELNLILSNPFYYICENKDIFHFIKELWLSNFKVYGMQDIALEVFDSISSNKSFDEKIKTINNILRYRRLHKLTKAAAIKNTPMQFSLDLIKEYVENINSFLDYGSGKLALLDAIQKEFKVGKLYGFDPKSTPKFLDKESKIKFITNIDELSILKDLDVIYSSFVFHHLTSKEIKESIEVFKKILAKNGKIIFLEETFSNDKDLFKSSSEKLKLLGYSSNIELTNIFNSLSVKERLLCIYLNDYLINLKNLSYMPWTYEYKSLDEWEDLFIKNNFKIVNRYYFGITNSNRLKQGVTGMLLIENFNE